MTTIEILHKILESDNVSVCGRCQDCEHLHECWVEEMQQFHDCKYYKERKVLIYGMDTRTTQTI